MDRRFKYWGILKEVFRHRIPKYAEVMYDVAVIAQIAIDNGEKKIMLIIVICNGIFSSPSLGEVTHHLVGRDNLVCNMPEYLITFSFITISNHYDSLNYEHPYGL